MDLQALLVAITHTCGILTITCMVGVESKVMCLMHTLFDATVNTTMSVICFEGKCYMYNVCH